jgi:hypothetical protein
MSGIMEKEHWAHLMLVCHVTEEVAQQALALRGGQVELAEEYLRNRNIHKALDPRVRFPKWYAWLKDKGIVR